MPRQKIQFTQKEIEQIKTLARCHCPDSEIAAYMECGENTIKRRFGPLIKEQREVGKSNIRAKQFRLAMEGDKTMLVWLGKQLLGQRERFVEDQPVIVNNMTSGPGITSEQAKELVRVYLTEKRKLLTKAE